MIASDETSARVKGKTHWQSAFGCGTAIMIAPTRSKCVPTDFLAGVRPKVWLRIDCRRSAHILPRPSDP